MSKIFALVDCNSFYVSCERVFAPALRTKPVVVLSNNDGCVISRSNEAKEAGIGMGAPFFKCQDLIKTHGIKVFSANFVLYGDMSNRVMSVLSQFTPHLEVYSIDEAFLSLDEIRTAELDDYAREIRVSVKKQTGLPVSVGVGSTKTLAKIANHIAKDHAETEGVSHLTDENVIERWLKATPVREVWGIGRNKAAFLQENGILTAWELRNAPDDWIKKHLTVVTLRTVWELRGTSCLSLEEAAPDKNAIATTRSFGYKVTDLSEMLEAIAAYTSKSAEKLRRQNSIAGFVQVYVETARHGNKPYYYNSAGAGLPPTGDTSQLIKTAQTLVQRIFREGLAYKSCGVFLMNLMSANNEQGGLFEEKYDGSRKQSLMTAVDEYNRNTGRGKIFMAAEGLGKPWYMKQAYKSRMFTTRWDELLEVNV